MVTICVVTGSHVNSHKIMKIKNMSASNLELGGEKTAFPWLFGASNKALDCLTTGFILGATLRDVGAEHSADSWVCCEAPGEFLAIWIPTEVFPQVPAQQGKSSRNLL